MWIYRISISKQIKMVNSCRWINFIKGMFAWLNIIPKAIYKCECIYIPIPITLLKSNFLLQIERIGTWMNCMKGMVTRLKGILFQVTLLASYRHTVYRPANYNFIRFRKYFQKHTCTSMWMIGINVFLQIYWIYSVKQCI